MMKIPVSAASCHLVTIWWNSGSILKGDYETGIESLHTDLMVESEAPEEDVARLIAMAERGCYVLSALDRPPTPTMDVTLNGEPFEIPSD